MSVDGEDAAAAAAAQAEGKEKLHTPSGIEQKEMGRNERKANSHSSIITVGRRGAARCRVVRMSSLTSW